MSHDHVHSDSYYIKIWGLLLVLLVISIVGPMFEIKVVTLITAFGVAGVKAGIVCSYFMHLNVEKKIMLYMLGLSLALASVFFFGVAGDIMNHSGTNWVNCAIDNSCPVEMMSPKS